MVLNLRQYIITIVVLIIMSFMVSAGFKYGNKIENIIDGEIIQFTKNTTIVDYERNRIQQIRKLINNTNIILPKIKL